MGEGEEYRNVTFRLSKKGCVLVVLGPKAAVPMRQPSLDLFAARYQTMENKGSHSVPDGSSLVCSN